MPVIIPVSPLLDTELVRYRFACQAVVQVGSRMDRGVVQASVDVQGGQAVPIFIDLVSEEFR